MRISELKAQVYERCGVCNTPQLKKEYGHLTKGIDLRFKKSWQKILADLSDDYTLADMTRDDQRLKQSLHRVGRVLGHSHQDVEESWERMNDMSLERYSKSKDCRHLTSLEIG